ncbi:ATP-binding protein [Sneathiella chungangensis]|nr:ATP-binding protein [Sneathiella chungangensis]
MSNNEILAQLTRIADSLDRLAPAEKADADIDSGDAFVWEAESNRLRLIPKVNHVDMSILHGIDRVRDILYDNTLRFAKGLPANNALLWGARGMGKSSLVKASHAQVNREIKPPLVLIEIHREDIPSLPILMQQLQKTKRRCVIFCDDLSFDSDDSTYKSLKTVLDGGLEGRPANVIFYATSNRRHMMRRDMIENERATAIMPSEAIEEKVSLSDRFGLWLGFHSCSQDEYLEMIRRYLKHYKIPIEEEQFVAEAIEWTRTRGSRSGRVAWQYVQDIAGRTGTVIDQDR